jgi:hypothetical protein
MCGTTRQRKDVAENSLKKGVFAGLFEVTVGRNFVESSLFRTFKMST